MNLGLKKRSLPSLASSAAIMLAAQLSAGIILTEAAQASPVFNGGPTMTGTNDVYYIWLGNWGADSAQTILPQLISDLNGSTYMNIITSYGDSNQVNFGGQYVVKNTDPFFHASLTGNFSQINTQIQSIVTGALAAGDLGPTDPHGIYDVLTAPTYLVDGFNHSRVDFCGFHNSTSGFGVSNTLGTQYGFIGDPTQGFNIGGFGCNTAVQDAPSTPGNNFGADAMASVLSHELFETITDPTGTAFFDSNAASSTAGNENGDMCNFNFGPTFTTGSGANANVTLNGTNYLLQQQWLNQGGGLGFTGGTCTTALALTNGPNGGQVPEPTTIALFGTAVAALGAIRRRRKTA